MSRPDTSGRITEYVLLYSKDIEMTDRTLSNAIDLAQQLEEHHQVLISGKSSRGLATAVIWLSSLRFIEDYITQQEFSNRLLSQYYVSADTVRRIAREIAGPLSIEIPRGLTVRERERDKKKRIYRDV